ncbi:MAG: wax synthase family protein [Gemmataceae bacterium]
MSAYWPHEPTRLAIVAALFAVELALGFALPRLPGRRRARLLAWLLTGGAGVLVERITADEPSGLRMIALILGVLYGLKAIVAVESGTRLSPLRWLGFCVLWFGMRPEPFRKAGGPPQLGVRRLLVHGLVLLLAGAVLMVTAWGVWRASRSRWLATPPLLVGLSFVLHFGFFNVFAALWRWLGVDCRPLFRAPILATGLNEFWSKRWNLAFSEMTAVAVYRPVAASLGRRAGIFASFVVSGALHELAISVPVKAGYGLPMAYFLLHGVLVLTETALARHGRPIDNHPILGRVWTLAALALPLPLLFHPPFLAGVVWPLIGINSP